MSVHYAYDTGRPGNILPTILRRISAFTRCGKVDYFKIGITNNPERRWNESYKGFYDRMLVVYCSKSRKHVSRLEYEVVNHNWNYCDNSISGGGGRIAKDSSYFYLYVVIRY
jgi:hypothetical protein